MRIRPSGRGGRLRTEWSRPGRQAASSTRTVVDLFGDSAKMAETPAGIGSRPIVGRCQTPSISVFQPPNPGWTARKVSVVCDPSDVAVTWLPHVLSGKPTGSEVISSAVLARMISTPGLPRRPTASQASRPANGLAVGEAGGALATGSAAGDGLAEGAGPAQPTRLATASAIRILRNRSMVPHLKVHTPVAWRGFPSRQRSDSARLIAASMPSDDSSRYVTSPVVQIRVSPTCRWVSSTALPSGSM